MKLFEFFGKMDLEHGKNDDNTSDDQKYTKADQDKLADEIFWFILDDDQLHKEMFLPLALEISEKQKSKSFDHNEYVKKWMPIVNKGCLKFYKKQEMIEDPKTLFPLEMRKGLCERLAEQHHEDISKGEYKF